MDIAVLVKVVPDLEHLRYDPERKTMVREAAGLFLNPFDQRAVRVALDLRRPGEKVSVVSMGPPSAEVPLRETLALGADRALLVSDRLLAGSDTLATSRTLVRALAHVGHDLVLAGRWTTDSETGQVGPEVAGLLGIPVVSSARRLLRDEGGDGLEMTGDTDEGCASYRIEPPALLTIGEKITKIRRPSSAELASVRDRTVEILTAGDLHLNGDQVGLAGSPTVVEALVNEEPGRTPRVFGEGPMPVRVEAAVGLVQQLLTRPQRPPRPFSTIASPLRDEQEVVVVVADAAGHLDGSALASLSEVRRSLPHHWPSALWAGAAPSDAESQRLASAGAVRGYRSVLADAAPSSRVVALAVQQVLDLRPRAAAAIFSAHTFGREVAGQVAARAGLGLTGDAVALHPDPNGEILWSKPAFGGGVVAAIRSRTRPSLATIRPGALHGPPSGGVGSELPWLDVPFDPPEVRVRRTATVREIDPSYGELDSARVVLTIGMGVGGPEALERLRTTTQELGAAIAATRKVVDAGWVPRQLQVGLTGRSLAPDLAILVGVSGSTNHLVGWKRARVLMAVNPDSNAPVFRGTDVGIVGPWEDVLPALSARLAPLLRRRPAEPA